jgi:hypothetical protein
MYGIIKQLVRDAKERLNLQIWLYTKLIPKQRVGRLGSCPWR